MTTAKTALEIWGDKEYQKRARLVFPVLVRQAKAKMPIYYSDLALEIGMPNPRNLNYVLGCIGRTIEKLNKKRTHKIPPIQSLVINKQNKLPGIGVDPFLYANRQYSSVQRKFIIDRAFTEIFTFPYSEWDNILKELELIVTEQVFSEIIKSNIISSMYGEGEGAEHKALKEYISNNPNVIKKRFSPGEMEHRLPSGDYLDISFKNKKNWLAVEVKPSTSNNADIVRGIFQCVKYKAVMEAVSIAEASNVECCTLLVLAGRMPNELMKLAHTLGIQYIENFSLPS
jgi:hypothetical protein